MLLPTEFTLETAFPEKFLNQMKKKKKKKKAFVSAVSPKSISYTIKSWILLHSHPYQALAYLKH